MYTKMSCIHYWHGIDKPMVFINAIDDPIVPPQLLERVKDATSTFVLSIGTTLKR
jgi:predicted alpha/beta-fold hydrolase